MQLHITIALATYPEPPLLIKPTPGSQQALAGHCLRVPINADEHFLKDGHRCVGATLAYRTYSQEGTLSQYTPLQLTLRVKAFLVHLVQGTAEMQVPSTDHKSLSRWGRERCCLVPIYFIDLEAAWPLGELHSGGLKTYSLPSVFNTTSLPQASLCLMWNQGKQEYPRRAGSARPGEGNHFDCWC